MQDFVHQQYYNDDPVTGVSTSGVYSTVQGLRFTAQGQLT